MERGREESKKNSGEQPRQGEKPEARTERKSNDETVRGKNAFHDSGKRARILQCLGNLNALHKVQGALLGQMEREIG
jgi:hypothetical protein